MPSVPIYADLAPVEGMRRAVAKIEEYGPWAENIIEAREILLDSIRQADIVADMEKAKESGRSLNDVRSEQGKTPL